MRLSEEVTKKIIKKLLKGEDYRIEVVTLIDAEFLQFSLEFFKKVIDAKLKSQKITPDWYKEEFLNPSLTANDIAINSGLNKKTIHNMFNASTKEIIIGASNEHYDILFESIKKLTESETDLDLTLTIKLKGVSVDLNVSESLIVINTLAVKRSALRGGLWSTAGKRVEKPLVHTLCLLYGVSSENYSYKAKGNKIKNKSDFEREIDFFLINNNIEYKCEVKLMGRGNPESADAVIARESKIFIGDKLSDTNKKQLDSLKINWIELRGVDGFKRFKKCLENLQIPHKDVGVMDDKKIDSILEIVLKN